MSRARRFLAPRARAGNGSLGYLSQPLRELQHIAPALRPDGDLLREAARVGEAVAMCDEPECPGPAVVDAQVDLAQAYARLRHLADVEQRQRDREQLSSRLGELEAAERRMADARRRAKLRHVDMSHEFHIMERDLERARRGMRKPPPSVIRLLVTVEARLDFRPDLDAAA